MKKTLQRGFAILLSCALIIGANFTSVFAAQSFWQRIGTGALGTVISGALGAINSILPDGKNFIAEEDYESHDFYKGNDTFLSAEMPIAKVAKNRTDAIRIERTFFMWFLLSQT